MSNQLSVSLYEATQLIAASGDKVTYLLEGDMGTGKSSVLWSLADMFPDHHAVYLDCTAMVDSGDLALPNLKERVVENGTEYIRMVPTESLGLHMGKPVIIMIDEIGKNRALTPSLTRLIHERNYNGNELPEGSIVFATTNKMGENVGDFLDPHQLNRVTILPVRKSSAEDWSMWAVNNNIHRSVLGFVREFPQVLNSYEEHEDPNTNRYIFHPKDPGRRAFVTGRSLEKSSHILRARDEDGLPDQVTKVALAGTIGAAAALDMMAYVQLSDKMPTMETIKSDPDSAPVPDSICAIAMLVYNVAGSVQAEWVGPWMRYLVRLPEEAQAMFVNLVTKNNYDEKKQKLFARNAEFRDWLMKNRHMYQAES